MWRCHMDVREHRHLSCSVARDSAASGNEFENRLLGIAAEGQDFCQPFCQQEGPVSSVFCSSQQSREVVKYAQNDPKTRKIITDGT
jgi:hypothetical protein